MDGPLDRDNMVEMTKQVMRDLAAEKGEKRAIFIIICGLMKTRIEAAAQALDAAATIASFSGDQDAAERAMDTYRSNMLAYDEIAGKAPDWQTIEDVIAFIDEWHDQIQDNVAEKEEENEKLNEMPFWNGDEE